MLNHTQHFLGQDLRGRVEVVFVSWDSSGAEMPMRTNAEWSERLSTPFLTVRVSSVSHEEAMRYSQSLGVDGASVGYFEFECKNRALSLAQGNYMLLTNVDILFSPCLIRGITKVVLARHTPSNVVWRAYRSDLHAPLPDTLLDMDVLTLLLEGANQTTLTRTSSGRIEDEHEFLEDELIDEACGDFMLASRSAWGRTRILQTQNYFVSLPYTWHMDSLQVRKRVSFFFLMFYLFFSEKMRRFRDVGVRQSIIYCRLYHRWHKKRTTSGKPRPAIPLEFLDRWSLYY